MDLCADALYLVCGPSTELVVGRAAYRAEGCTCPSCQGISAHERASALREVHRACTIINYCYVTKFLHCISVLNSYPDLPPISEILYHLGEILCNTVLLANNIFITVFHVMVSSYSQNGAARAWTCVPTPGSLSAEF